MNNSSTVAMISLGCPKNLVNSEEMLALLQDAGYAFTDDLAKADAVIINTCAFIESAKTEAIEKILETASYREENPELKIIVSGCLAQRYADDIRAELPEVDGIMGTGSYSEVVSVVEAVLAGDKPTRRGAISAPLYDTPRAVSTGPNWAYLRIAEGCDNRCAYCVIPSLRGKFRSRTKESILEEARLLAASGVKELIIVAQDITRYGIDLYGKVCLTELLKELCKLDFRWVRLHYLYPELIDDELIDEIASEDKIVKYLDIPIQHINDDILRRMNRRGNGEYVKELFAKLRREIPGLVLRTSLITGLPGEGEAEFAQLCDFLKEYKLERVGAFAFSPEEGTRAAEMEYPDTEIARQRADMVAEIQSRIMDDYNESCIGKTMQVLCEGYDPDEESYYGRTFADSPDIDGKIWFTAEKHIKTGDFADVRVVDAYDGELVGVLEEEYNDDCE